ncbi:hypothetical protein C8R47DRAFT_745205 [Mycena vitilis]|nr:hypothetical protein C8R47DRAFT_745205 [Mycena vitilis]
MVLPLLRCTRYIITRADLRPLAGSSNLNRWSRGLKIACVQLDAKPGICQRGASTAAALALRVGKLPHTVTAAEMDQSGARSVCGTCPAATKRPVLRWRECVLHDGEQDLTHEMPSWRLECSSPPRSPRCAAARGAGLLLMVCYQACPGFPHSNGLNSTSDPGAPEQLFLLVPSFSLSAGYSVTL